MILPFRAGRALLLGTAFLCLRPAAPAAETAAPEAGSPARALSSSFADIAQKVSPAVVVINVWYPEPSDDQAGPEGEEPAPEFFFPQPHGGPRRRGNRSESGHPDSQGSGFLVGADGTIYTNNHVIDRAERIEVKLKSGEKIPARVIGVDPNSDVAVIKIDPKASRSTLAFAELGDSEKVRVGEWAIAIGAPFGLEYSVTVGVISAKGRTGLALDPTRPMYEDYLQTDATINPGNSGGPLVNIEGKVIGINTLIRTSPGSAGFSNTNTGFAIPINMAHKNARQIIAQGRVIRPWLGIKIQGLDQVSEDVRKRLRGIVKGVVIQGIDLDTPASKADLKPFDVVQSIDGVDVNTAKQLQQEVLNKKVGQVVRLAVIRNGSPMEVELKTGELPTQIPTLAKVHPKPPVAAEGPYGMTVQPLTDSLARRFEVPASSGLLVSEVEPGSAASTAGLLPGDVLTEVDYHEVRTVAQLKKALQESDPDKGALLHLIRQGTRIYAVLKRRETVARPANPQPPATPDPKGQAAPEDAD